MNIETLREHVLNFEAVEECFPFGDDTLVFKTNAKIFLLVSLSASPLQFNAKCDPGKAVILREEYPDNILPGFHMNKKHWNTVIINGILPARLIAEMIEDSYELVKPKQPSRRR